MSVRLVLGLLARLLGWLLILSVPVSGVWLSSSLVAEANGPRWAVVGVGVLLCPVLPLVWEGIAEWRRRARRPKDRPEPERVTTRGDRVLLRTLALNFPFLLVMVWAFPDRALSAIATRGDWMLDGVDHEIANDLRGALQHAADALQAWNASFEDETWVELAETDTDRVPTRDEIPLPTHPEESSDEVETGEPSAETPPSLVAITLLPFDDATYQVRSEVHAGEHPFRIPRDEQVVPLSVTFSDRSRLSCPIVPTTDQTWRLQPQGDAWELVDASTPRDTEEPSADEAPRIPCEVLRGADPTWSVELRLQPPDASFFGLDERIAKALAEDRDDVDVALEATDGTWFLLGPVLVRPEEVVAIENVTPYYRLKLAPEASERLCLATRADAHVYRRLGVVVDGELRFVQLVNEALCTGYVPLETGDRAIQHAPEEDELPDADAASARWPIPAVPHPLASSLRAESIAELGRQIRDVANSELERAKLVHDWILQRTRYDRESIDDDRRRPQDADTVFRSGLAVCAGYANLFVALAEASGLEAAYVTGQVRELDGELAGRGHAWNAVKLGGRWALVDVTWNDTETYDTSFLFAPPEVFRHSHLPTHDAWQLHPTPLSRGEFLRQPMLRPAFFATSLELVSPNRSQVDASREVRVELRNPRGRSILAKIDERRCEVQGRTDVTIRCPVSAGARHVVRLFENATPSGRHDYVGGVRVNGL